MTIINVLGASSLIGAYFVDTNINYELVCYSRKNKIFTEKFKRLYNSS